MTVCLVGPSGNSVGLRNSTANCEGNCILQSFLEREIILALGLTSLTYLICKNRTTRQHLLEEVHAMSTPHKQLTAIHSPLYRATAPTAQPPWSDHQLGITSTRTGMLIEKAPD